MSNLLVQRGTTWHVRIDIPADLRPAFGNRKVLSKSLKTGDKLLARTLAAQISSQWKAQFRAIRDEKLSRGDAWREQAFSLSTSVEQMLQPWVLEIMGVQKRTPPTPEQIAQAEAGCITIPPDTKLTPVGPVFSFDLKGKAPAEQVSELQRMAQWIRDTEHDDVLNQFSLDKDQRQELKAILSSSVAYTPKSPISTSALKAFEQYQQTQTDNARTISMIMSKVQAFSAYLSTEGKPLDYDTVAEYLDTISLNRQTRQGHLWALRKFHKWATKVAGTYRDQFKGLTSPYDTHDHAKVGKNGSERWIPYTAGEVIQLHTAATSKADTVLADLIKFAAYSGCRIQEMGHISRSTTLFNDHGQPYAFKIESSKTVAGIRTVPIHPDLLPLYIQRLEQSQDGYLFEGTPDSDGKRLNSPQQRFTTLKRAEGFTDRHVFHSFRGAVVTLLEQAGANHLVITSIVGHKRGSLTFDTYSAGSSMDQKAEALSLLSYDFD